MPTDPVELIAQFDGERAAQLMEELAKQNGGSVTASIGALSAEMEAVFAGCAAGGLENVMNAMKRSRGCVTCAMLQVVFLSMVQGAALAQDAEMRAKICAEIGESDGSAGA